MVRSLLVLLVAILSSCAIQYHAYTYDAPKELTVYTNMSIKGTEDILEELDGDINVVAVKIYTGRTNSHKAIINDIMRIKDKGKILVLIDKTTWYCGWLLPCVFGATETINWDRAYATGPVSAVHESRHLFGWRDIL